MIGFPEEIGGDRSIPGFSRTQQNRQNRFWQRNRWHEFLVQIMYSLVVFGCSSIVMCGWFRTYVRQLLWGATDVQGHYYTSWTVHISLWSPHLERLMFTPRFAQSQLNISMLTAIDLVELTYMGNLSCEVIVCGEKIIKLTAAGISMACCKQVSCILFHSWVMPFLTTFINETCANF